MVKRRRDKRIWLVILGVFVAVFLFAFLAQRSRKVNEDVSAASLANFDPGYIISDYQMGNYNSMSEAEIQAFLTAKNPCSNTDYNYYKSLMAQYNGRVTWHWANGHFVCLSEEKFGDGEAIGSGETAAHIIWQAAQDYKINPQVLIVLLQKEQGLITDPIPNSVDYRAATGYGCPDTAACSSKYYGFKNQVRNAASLFRTVLNGGWTNYPLGENYIQYSPTASCGGSVVNVRNLATSALYRYTPYQPNAGALAAGYGTAYCGAYGNRNFYLYFQDWFGGITIEREWKEMQSPRVMKIEKKTMNVDPIKGETYQYQINYVGEKGYFVSKIDIIWNGKQEVCLRTATDTEQGIDRCVIMSRMKDTNEPLYTVQAIETKKFDILKDTYKYDLVTGKKVQDISIKDYSKISFSAKAVMNGKVFYQTTYDYNNDNKYFIPQDDIEGFEFVGFVLPRKLKIKTDTDFIDLETGKVCRMAKAGFIDDFSSKTFLRSNGKTFYRTREESDLKSSCVLDSKYVEEIKDWENVGNNPNLVFRDFVKPRELVFKETTYLIDAKTGKSCDTLYNLGDIIKFNMKITMNGNSYYRTETDSEIDSSCVVPDKILREL